MTELRPDLLRRVLVAMRGDNCDGLIWHVELDGSLRISAMCSDFFDWGTADAEPIESEQDVVLLESARDDLAAATNDPQPIWLGELYAARRRGLQPAGFMTDPSSRHYLGDETAEVFRRHATA